MKNTKIKDYVKIYLLTFIISAVLIALPWVLEILGVFAALDVLEWIGICFALVALVVSIVIVFRLVKELKFRILLILLNPSIAYTAVLIFIGLSIASEDWNGFNRI